VVVTVKEWQGIKTNNLVEFAAILVDLKTAIRISLHSINTEGATKLISSGQPKGEVEKLHLSDPFKPKMKYLRQN